MNRKIPALLLVLVLSFTLTACTIQDLPVIGGFFGKSNAPVTLKMWGLWEKPEVMDVLIKKYQETHPNVTIEYDDRSVVTPNEYKERVFTAGNSIDADIVTVHNSWVGALRGALSSAPSNLIDASNYAASYYPVATSSAVFDGKIYALPAYYDGLVLVYNKKHFAAINQAQAPTAWEEFRRVALRLSIRSGERGQGLVRAGAAIGTSTNIDHFSDILGLMFAQANVNVPNDLDSKPAQDALSFYVNFAKEDRVWDTTFPEASTAFAQEKVSMIFVPSWQVLDIMVARPDLEIGVAPVPQAVPSAPATWGTFWMYSVPSASKNSKAAWEFASFLAQEEAQRLLFSENSKMRAFGSVYALPSLGGDLNSNPYLKPLVDTASVAKSNGLAGRAGNQKAVDALNDAVKNVLQGQGADASLKLVKDAITQ